MTERRDRDECSEFRDFLTSSREHRLSPDEQPHGSAEKLRSHLESCAECRRFRDASGWEWDLLGKASLPAPRLSDPEFLAATHRRVQRSSARRLVIGALAAAAAVAALGIGWLLPVRDDQAVIENLAVLEDLQDMPIDLLTFLEDESRPSAPTDIEDEDGLDDELIQQILLEEGGNGKRG